MEKASFKVIFSIFEHIQTSVNGLTRTIKFDHQGHRTDFIADIIELGAAGIERVGSWNATEGLNISRRQDVKLSNIDDGSLKNRSFIVLHALVCISVQ